jgi:hypothetical protein
MDHTSPKGARHKVFEGFIYRFDRASADGGQNWRCIKKQCSGRIHIIGENIEKKTQHNHVVDPGMYPIMN